MFTTPRERRQFYFSRRHSRMRLTTLAARSTLALAGPPKFYLGRWTMSGALKLSRFGEPTEYYRFTPPLLLSPGAYAGDARGFRRRTADCRHAMRRQCRLVGDGIGIAFSAFEADFAWPGAQHSHFTPGRAGQQRYHLAAISGDAAHARYIAIPARGELLMISRHYTHWPTFHRRLYRRGGFADAGVFRIASIALWSPLDGCASIDDDFVYR